MVHTIQPENLIFIDKYVFVSTADFEKEPLLVTANTIVSILVTDYLVEKLTCYVSNDKRALLTIKALAEAASFVENII